MQAQLSPKPGQLVGGKYQIVGTIGHGAMGVVFEAHHATTGKRVAIKWLHPHVMESRSAVERLVREAQASARIRHPNVVDVYDVEREADAVFLVMEYLEGEPLAKLLERGGVPFHELLALIVQAMRGVAEAHRQSIVHRDIKPDNIFVAVESDQPMPLAKVLDFGISKFEVPGGLALTQTGSTLGTPLYMSYEQLAGVRDVDARADVYAFGVILYEALTGTLPYVAESFAELAAKVMTTDPLPPGQIRPDIPERLEQVVLWAMEKRREQRAPNLGVVIEALLPFTVPWQGPASISSPVLSSSHHSVTHVSSIRPPPSQLRPSSRPPDGLRPTSSLRAPAPMRPPAPQLRLGGQATWNSGLDYSQRSRRVLEDRVSALMAGTIPDYPTRRKAPARRGLWMAIGALTTLAGGLVLASAMRPAGSPTVPTPNAPITTPAAGAVTPAERPPEPPQAQPPPQTQLQAVAQPAPAAGDAVPAAPPAAPEPEPQAAPVEPAATTAAPVPAPAPTTAPAQRGSAKASQPGAPSARRTGQAGAGRVHVWRPSGEDEPEPMPTMPAPAPAVPASEEPYPPPAAPPPAAEAEPPVDSVPRNPVDRVPDFDEEPRYRAGKPSEEEF